jgi:hypothetical protein
MRKTLVTSTVAGVFILAGSGIHYTAAAGTGAADPPLTKDQIGKRIYDDEQAIDAAKAPMDYYYLTSLIPLPTASQVDSYEYKNAGLKPPTPSSKGPPSCDVAPTLFVRHDRLDTFQLRDQPQTVSGAKGASISGTDDERTSTEQLIVNGRAEYVLFGYDGACGGSTASSRQSAYAGPYYGYTVAPFVDAQGTIDTPAKKTDVHNLQAGLDAQFTILNGQFFDDQYVIFTPYYQTDFDGAAQIEGVTAAWEPVLEAAHLGGYTGSPNGYLGWYWQVRGEFDEKHVTTVGYTGLTKGDYEWFGGTAQVHFDLFPNANKGNPFYKSPDPWLEDKLYINLTLKSFWNAADNRSATWFEGELGCNLTSDGKSSVSVKYDLGTDKDTLITSKKYLLSLNYKN